GDLAADPRARVAHGPPSPGRPPDHRGPHPRRQPGGPRPGAGGGGAERVRGGHRAGRARPDRRPGAVNRRPRDRKSTRLNSSHVPPYTTLFGSSGIWRPIHVHAWHTARLAQVVPLITVARTHDGSLEGRVLVRVEVERSEHGEDTELVVRVRIADREQSIAVPAGVCRTELEVTVPDPDLWWPRGYGDQPLYDLRVDLAAHGEELDTWQRRIGFRTVELDTGVDEDGRRFTIVVNGVPVLVKGANWIPDDCFVSR